MFIMNNFLFAKIAPYFKFILLNMLIISALLITFARPIKNRIRSYALSSTEQAFGDKPLAAGQEEKITAIARKMGISQSIIIRRMNRTSLLLFGYHNAFAYFPSLLNIIPLSNQPFLFISEGFFEDLSPAEQDFLIGHELIHIQEGHLRYLYLAMLPFELLLLAACWIILRRYLWHHIRQSIFYKKILSLMAFFGLGVSFLGVPAVIESIYRRHIEYVADAESLKILHTYQGCNQLIDRWQREWSLPSYNSYFGLFSTHPSCAERKAHCHKLHQQYKEQL